MEWIVQRKKNSNFLFCMKMDLDLVDAAEAISVEELDEVPDGSGTGHVPQALHRTLVLQLGVGGVGSSRGFLRYSGAVQRARLQQNPRARARARARALVQRLPTELEKSAPDSHDREDGKKWSTVGVDV